MMPTLSRTTSLWRGSWFLKALCKTIKNIKLVLFFSLIFPISITGAVRAATPLKFCFEDVPQAPWTMPDGTGLNIELLKRVERQLGEKFEFVAKPWKRCLDELRTGVQDGAFGSAVSADRRRFSLFPSNPDGSDDSSAALNEDHARVYIRKDSKAKWNGKNLLNVRQPILVPRAYLVADILQQQGFQIREIQTIHEALQLLAMGKAEVAILQGAEVENLVKFDSNYRSKINSVAPHFLSLSMYLPINQQTYARDPRRIKAIWNAIRQVRATPEYKQLVNAAGIL
jgi:polar amino acid transport system substrate-binding protein